MAGRTKSSSTNYNFEDLKCRPEMQSKN